MMFSAPKKKYFYFVRCRSQKMASSWFFTKNRFNFLDTLGVDGLGNLLRFCRFNMMRDGIDFDFELFSWRKVQQFISSVHDISDLTPSFRLAVSVRSISENESMNL